MAPITKKSAGSSPGSNNFGGRKRSKEWDFVRKINANSFRCLFCNALVSGKICRIQKHLASCTEAKKHSTAKDDVIEIDDNSRESAQSSCTMDRFVIKTTTADKQELDLAVARFFYAANIPFRQIENEHFLQLLDKLRKGYVPPTRNSLSDEFLEKIHTECCTDVSREFTDALDKGMAITLCQVTLCVLVHVRVSEYHIINQVNILYF